MADNKTEQFIKVYNDTMTYPTLADVARELDIAVKTVKNTAAILRRRAKDKTEDPPIISRQGKAASVIRTGPDDELEIPQIDDPDEPIEDLIQRAAAHHDKLAKFEAARECITIRVNVEGPFAVCGIPDPHLNNVGTDLREAFRVADTIHDTPGLYAVGIGDWLDNFIIGRLERERRKDIMSHSDANRIQEHFVTTIIQKLIAAIGGNHNDWIEMLGGMDPLKRLFSEYGVRNIYDADELRVRLVTPNGAEFIHHARHVYPGHSQFHPTHGIIKWILQNWQGEDVFWGGHIHEAGHMCMERHWQGKAKVVRGIQLAAFKKIDGYQKKRGFRKNVPFLVPVVVHDPVDGSSQFFEDFDRGVAYLKEERKKHVAAAA